MTETHPDQMVEQRSSNSASDTLESKRIIYGCTTGDLFVWISRKDKSPLQFQLYYFTHGDYRREYIIEFDGKKINTGTVDSREVAGGGGNMSTPVIRFSSIDSKNVIANGINFMDKNGKNLPPKLGNWVLKILKKGV